jgi:RHS repeat-associated protein
MYLPEKLLTSVSTDSKQREVGYLGKQVFELSNHLGNVLATITDKKLQVSNNTTSTAYFEADVQTVQDYYAFGMQMPGRKLSGGYRFGFNGKENDNEVKGEGNIIDFGERIYESRLGRWLAVDMAAKSSPGETPYRFGHNNPVRFLDPNGQWEEDGHFWTVYAMGVAKGLSKARAYEIAKKAEYFDHFVHRDANGNINMSIHPSSTGLAWGKDGGLGTWADGSKQGDWHALTGGLQAHANNRAKHNILTEGDLNYLHTLGDSWAHSYVDENGVRKMWGGGHYVAGVTLEHKFFGGYGNEDADNISKRPQEYGSWVNDLNNIMNNDLFSFKSEVKNLNPDKSIFRYVQQYGGSKDANIYLLKNYIDLQTGTKSFSTSNEKYNEKFEGYLKSIGIKYTSSITTTESTRISTSASGNVPITISTKTTTYNIKINQ